jgi:hypothetical protein
MGIFWAASFFFYSREVVMHLAVFSTIHLSVVPLLI